MEELAQVERELWDQSAQLSSQEEYFVWERKCDEYLESLEGHSRAKRPRLSIGVAQTLVARIARLESLKNSVRARFIHTGAGHSARDTGLVWREIETAFESRVLTGAVLNSNYIEPHQFFKNAKNIVFEHLQRALKKHNSIKVNTVFSGEFVAGDKRANKSINIKNCALFLTSNLEEWYEQRVVEPTLTSLEEFQERDSGWALTQIHNLLLNVNKYNPLRAGCNVEIPREIQLKRAVVNVQAKDNACFAWAVIAALYPVEKKTERKSSYPNYTTVLNLQDIQFPMKLNQIKRFEHLNNISINVYSILEKEKKKEEACVIVPIHLTNNKKDRHINLLYIQNQHDHNDGHYAWIKNLSRLVSSQINKKRHTKYICDRCLHYFTTPEKLHAHIIDCREMNDCAIVLPKDDNKWLSFGNHNRKERVPFVVYADLECILEKTSRNGENDKVGSYAYQHHNVFSIGYYTHCSYDKSLSTFRIRRNPDCISWFVGELQELSRCARDILITNVPMETLTKEEWLAYRSATHCHICEKPFATDDTRVRDHCHLTGKYRGPAHSNCNLNYKDSYIIPIVFHNLSGYDSHFIIKEIATAFEGKIEVLPITKEKYISFKKTVNNETGKSEENEKSKSKTCIQLRFIDSYKFLNTSLDKLASFLDKDKLKIVRSEFQNLSNEDFNLLTRKGIFPYEYLDCVNKLQDPRLPSRKSFYSSLTDDTVSESDYAHAVNV